MRLVSSLDGGAETLGVAVEGGVLCCSGTATEVVVEIEGIGRLANRCRTETRASRLAILDA
jgi:hypothetical protein